ncbi:aldolase/citrate lyase family protein [Sulfurospirillum multivorans]|uniref:HpcH_HpaI superfamily domain-containing protein n=2 Tax=Sulfurospirillum multivorans TaxID=66821 RepID=A0AA86AQH0_SULMK|nr:aldolase/citrate lyase family protein [Sulfurospirillum multivorans]AHJ13798.1 HpcH_HpaI superfamily domain-containing protein [Sulfurospirillum multivorans DSM 12446]QEH07288.1 HpcH_HpaI superfamily domain-containing protein [Sulfurospirillum multivorans]
MFGIEIKLYDQLCKLRDEYALQGIKAEFEAEGSSFRDLMRLRRLTSKAGIKLFLKIGGVEAVRDIKDAAEIDVDGIIAPMVESKFGAKKFADSIKKVYGECKIHTTLNLETKNAMEQLDEILEFAIGKFDNITIGRSDLTASYFNEDIKPDSEFTFKLLQAIGQKIQNANLTFTVGGSVSGKTIEIINSKYPNLKNMIYKLETRKVILPTKIFLETDNAIKEALKFEELYILSKKEFSDLQIGSEIARLTELKRRM